MTHRLKVCRTCGGAKPLNSFYRHPTYADGHMSDCKVCKRAYSREMHWLKRETRLAQKRVYAATPKAREARATYARTERGRRIMNEARRMWRKIQRMDAHV
jgi:hypothetical protein